MPIIRALINKIKARLENALGSVINGLTGANLTTVAFTGTTAEERGKEIISQVQRLNLQFNKVGVSTEGRYLAVGDDVALDLLATPALLSAANTGEQGTSQALRDAVIGRIAGFTVFTSDKIDVDSMVGYSADGFGLVSAAPGPSFTASYSEVETFDKAPIDVRVNLIGMGKRNADGILAETFFNAAQLVEDGATSNPRAKKVKFTPAALSFLG
jgi:hypothetical protein